mmetsp:Transcript_26587/g.48107  ORF Transcript_26587/g.48107 Transcript_26587/m.48107 type:complete len:112 (+) Transcript_26587:1375-1710(+)
MEGDGSSGKAGVGECEAGDAGDAGDCLSTEPPGLAVALLDFANCLSSVFCSCLPLGRDFRRRFRRLRWGLRSREALSELHRCLCRLREALELLLRRLLGLRRRWPGLLMAP